MPSKILSAIERGRQLIAWQVFEVGEIIDVPAGPLLKKADYLGCRLPPGVTDSVEKVENTANANSRKSLLASGFS